ncbi:MAG: hypothetical protein KR126chlam6_00419 [Candidatus Anoxychlamydiales bacterium]|nr:hypothetical protein [Candidatus Anoxychlamydiales bacterium]
MKAANFSSPGLGDGLIAIALSHNLYLNDIQIDTFHSSLSQMQSYFPHLLIKNYPQIDEIPKILDSFDQIFISYNENSPFIMKLILDGKNFYPKKIFVLNPCPSKKLGGQPYFEDAFFKPNLSMVDNIDLFCNNVLKLKKTSKKIDLTIPTNLIFQKFKKRIIFHPSGAKKSKNWQIQKYIKLAKYLIDKGFEPVFVVSENETNEFVDIEKQNLDLKSFDNLNDLAAFIYESSFMIGNDSGIGHLSSFLGLDTISIFRNHRSASLWRPSWSQNKTVFPNRFIPNISFYRLRDKHWKIFISTRQILKYFDEMI